MKRKFIFILLSAIILISISGVLPASSIASIAKAENEKNQKTYAIIYPVLHPFFEAVTKGAESEGKLSNAQLIIKGPEIEDLKVEQQIDIMNKLISKKVDGIAIGPTDAIRLAPVINKAIQNGIKVLCFDTDSPKSNRIAYIGTNNLAAGKHMGEVLVKLLHKRGKIICLTGVSTQLNLRQRIEGVKAVLKKYPDMKLVEVRSNMGDPNKAEKSIEEMMKLHPDFSALIGVDSLTGPAAITIWKAMGLKKTLLTFDNLPEILDGIRYGQITATISQNQYKWGELIIKNLDAACQKKPIPKMIYTKTTEINKQNIDAVGVDYTSLQ